MTTDKLIFGVDAVGAAKAAAEIDKVTGAVKKSVVATAESTKATQAQTLQIGQLGSSLGLAGQALGRVNPLVGQLTTMAGSATGVIQTLSTAGLGPLGVALGVVSGAITLGVALWKEHKDAQDAAAASIRQTLMPAVADLAREYDEASEAARRFDAIAAGGGRSSEVRALSTITGDAVSQASDRLEALRRERGALGVNVRGPGAGRAIDAGRADVDARIAEQERLVSYLSRQQEAAAQQADRLADEEAGGVSMGSAATAAGPARAEATRRARSSGARTASRDDMRAERAKASEYGFASAQRAYDEQQSASAFGGADALKQKAGREAALQQEAADAFMASERSKTEFLAQQKRERDELTMTEAQKGIEVWGAYGESLGNVFGQALMSEQNVGKALQNGLKAWAKGFAIQEIGKGMSATAEGIGAATNPITAAMAPGYFAAAGQHFAAAAVVGAIGVAIPSAGGGGNRGGSGGGARIPSEHNAMRSGGGSQTVVINMSGPIVATSDRAALGRELNALVGEGQRRYGAA